MTNGATLSCWLAELAFHQSYPALDKDLTCDVCVIGAGLAGVSVAYMLSREGKQVIVIDKDQPGDGETGRTTAHLASALDDRFFELEKLFGADGARLAAASHAAAIDRIESIAAEEGIDCDFRRLNGYLFEPTNGDVQNLHRELEAARRAGLSVEMLARAPLEYDTGPCLQFARQGQFHPMKYLAGLLSAVQRRGGRIFGGTAATNITGGHPCKVTTSTGKSVLAGSVVVATNAPINDRVVMHTKQAAYRTYAIAVRVVKGSVAPGLYWDDADPYHYVRLHPWGEKTDLLIVGGEDHRTGQPPTSPAAPFTNLEKWTRRLFPDSTAIVQQWSGQILEPVDGLAFIGRNPMDDEHIYIATGDSGHGMTHATIAGMLISDLILGRGNAWADLYSPKRRTARARSAGSFLRENLNVVAQYADYIAPSGVGDESEVRKGVGMIQRQGTKRVALYRDEEGVLHKLSAVCPHLSCVVHWNAVEKTWDCPCHGSRFSAAGKVLCGPAASDLTPIEEPQAWKAQPGEAQPGQEASPQ